MRVAILYGGRSGEHEVSLSSAAFFVRNLAPEHRLTLIGVTKAGRWKLQAQTVLDACREGEGPLELRAEGPEVVIGPGQGLKVFGTHGVSELNVDIVIPVLHGTFGEDGTVQGLLECAGLPYVGADVLGSAVGMDKEIAKALWREAGLPVVPSIVAHDGEDGSLSKLASQAESRFGWPVFVKPARTGSSVGAGLARSRAELGPAVREALRWDTKALIEPFIDARELECSVIGNGEPIAFTPGEIAPTHEFYSYEAKYVDPNGARLLIPAPAEPELLEKVRALAVAAYGAAGTNGLARVDFFLDRASGELYLNELNTMPGFTGISMFPMMCQHGGLPYRELLDRLIELGLERKRARDALTFSR